MIMIMIINIKFNPGKPVRNAVINLVPKFAQYVLFSYPIIHYNDSDNDIIILYNENFEDRSLIQN